MDLPYKRSIRIVGIIANSFVLDKLSDPKWYFSHFFEILQFL